MNKIEVHLPDGRVSGIFIGESIKHIQHHTHNQNIIVITEANIYEQYQQHFPPNAPIIFIKGGEENKTMATIAHIAERLIELGADRGCYLIGIGGGIVCDITGFAASIYMRGVSFGFVATTLLAQVDASVGGKNGVNFNRYKNMLGVFNQPDFVLCDTGALKTLPMREVKAGLAEVVKTALIADKGLFEYIEQNANNILELNETAINHIVKRSVQIKASVVEADEREAGERRKLNLGHTFGHAIEKHGNLLHGEAVSIGLVIAAQLSHKLNLISEIDVQRIAALLSKLGLPTSTDIDKELLLDAVTKDKKRQNQSVYFILNEGIGCAKVQPLAFNELKHLF